MPDFFDDDRALVTLELPDNENFTDNNWAMNIFSVDLYGIINKAGEIFSKLRAHDYSGFPQEVQDILNSGDEAAAVEQTEKPGFFEALLEALAEISKGSGAEAEPVPEPVDSDEDLDTISKWLSGEFRPYIYSDTTAAGQDNRTINMVVRPGRTIPILIHITMREDSYVPDQTVFAIFVNNKWYVLPVDVPEVSEETDSPQETLTDILVKDFLETLPDKIGNISSFDDVLDLFTVNIPGGGETVIPSTGLEDIVLPEPADPAETAPAELPEPGKKSRPKL